MLRSFAVRVLTSYLKSPPYPFNIASPGPETWTIRRNNRSEPKAQSHIGHITSTLAKHSRATQIGASQKLQMQTQSATGFKLRTRKEKKGHMKLFAKSCDERLAHFTTHTVVLDVHCTEIRHVQRYAILRFGASVSYWRQSIQGRHSMKDFSIAQMHKCLCSFDLHNSHQVQYLISLDPVSQQNEAASMTDLVHAVQLSLDQSEGLRPGLPEKCGNVGNRYLLSCQIGSLESLQWICSHELCMTHFESSKSLHRI